MKKGKQGISLIVLIVTIIVIIILAAAVILTLSKNNPIESAREAKFKEDVRSFKDDLSLTIAKEYTNAGGQRDEKINASSYADMKKYIPSFTMEYNGKFVISNDELMYDEDNVTENEAGWLYDLNVSSVPSSSSNVPAEWEATIASVTEDGVPIPKGFTFVKGAKSEGTVIQDSLGNEFVWIPATEENYVKDLTFPGNQSTSDDTLPSGITDETADVIKYGGFYIARYEAGTPDGTETTRTNSAGVPLSKKDVVVWSDINYTNAKSSAEQMISNDYVQTGLLTGKAWDRTCHWIEDSVSSITNSRTYGNYRNSAAPANVTGYGTKQNSGYSDEWCVKNIYDLAGNVWEWTNEEVYSSYRVGRGGSYCSSGDYYPVVDRGNLDVGGTSADVGFRARLYIK